MTEAARQLRVAQRSHQAAHVTLSDLSVHEGEVHSVSCLQRVRTVELLPMAAVPA